jgi:uncharacterized beta-barrel protein YwiB (DUF1934 family)
MHQTKTSSTLNDEVIEGKPVKYSVSLRQVTTFEDGPMRESVELEADGTLFEAKDGFAVKFVKQDEQPINTTIKWSKDQIALNRKGPVAMHHIFILKETTKSQYGSQFGQVLRETDTETIEMKPQ